MATQAIGAIKGTFSTRRRAGTMTSKGNKYRAKNNSKMAIGKIFHLLHRAAICGIALRVVYLSFSATYGAFILLRGDRYDWGSRDNGAYAYRVVQQYAGTDSIRQSPLVLKALGGDTTPLVGKSLYLREDSASFTPCTTFIDELQAEIFSDEFMRSVYTAIEEGTGYYIPEFNNTVELIAPVVDCSMGETGESDTTGARFHFLARKIADHDQVLLIVVSLSNQQYNIPEQLETGAAGIASVQMIYSMRDTDVRNYFAVSIGYPTEPFEFRAYEFIEMSADGQWALQSIPSHSMELTKNLFTSFRVGFYIKGETEQSSIDNMIWTISTNAQEVIEQWHWTSKAVLHDSWAWVHGIQFLIGTRLFASLFVLAIATYQNFRTGKMWIGDAFVSLSTSQLINGFAVLFSWFMNEFWALHEYSFHMAYNLADVYDLEFYEAPMYADLFTIYLSACGIIGTLFRERIDPFLALICFEIGYTYRINLVDLVPSIRDQIVAHATEFYRRGDIRPYADQGSISPMSLWLSHPIGKKNYSFLISCLAPMFFTLIVIILYVIGRKMYRRFNPSAIKNQQNTSGTARRASTEDMMLAQKRVLTLFEVATGAELENRFGLVADYESCRFIKGMKFASADGIYSNGFVIANKKFLVQASDFWTILLIKTVRARVANVYVYEVNGSTVQPRARLLYAHTMTMVDLVNLNVSVLS